MQKIKDRAHKTFVNHKHHCLATLSLIVLAVHWVNPEMEAIAFAIAGVITTELA